MRDAWKSEDALLERLADGWRFREPFLPPGATGIPPAVHIEPPEGSEAHAFKTSRRAMMNMARKGLVRICDPDGADRQYLIAKRGRERVERLREARESA